MLDRPFIAAGVMVAVVLAVATVVVGRQFAIFLMPFSWTGEPASLIDLLGLQPGDRVADIGAGDGAHAVAVAHILGSDGEVLATDIDPERRRAIADRAGRAGVKVRVLEGAADRTNLADRCCAAIYMRMMLHHVADRKAFARDVVRSVEPGGRVAVIDFAPGRLWFHGRDHGVAPEDIASAFTGAGCTLRRRDDRWGGPTFLLLFECGTARSATARMTGIPKAARRRDRVTLSAASAIRLVRLS
jgi:SAM-dependent methyltransferase